MQKLAFIGICVLLAAVTCAVEVQLVDCWCVVKVIGFV